MQVGRVRTRQFGLERALRVSFEKSTFCLLLNSLVSLILPLQSAFDHVGPLNRHFVGLSLPELKLVAVLLLLLQHLQNHPFLLSFFVFTMQSIKCLV